VGAHFYSPCIRPTGQVLSYIFPDYNRLKALMDLCYQGHADGRYSKLLTKLNHSGLLLLDDWGLEPLSSEQRSDLLEIVDLMYQRGSIIVLGQLPVESWYKPVTVGLFTVD